MKVWFVGRKTGMILGVIAAAFFALIMLSYFKGGSAAISAASGDRDLPIYCVQKDENDKKLSISFDAAWGNEDTENLINILGERNIKTTFFVVGDWVDKYPESVKALSDAGHEVMNHSSKHPHMTQISKDEMIKELNDCGSKIEAVTGRKPELFRPP